MKPHFCSCGNPLGCAAWNLKKMMEKLKEKSHSRRLKPTVNQVSSLRDLRGVSQFRI
ncbi:MAG: hypothetical protein LBB79_06620 [Prevotellaceae bacterium]|nr:hypothetical protein [Prevotellaceae bacterium]